jgi:hypothetical protein
MRRIAEPYLERTVKQAAHTVHEKIAEHDVPKQLTLDGLRSDVPYAYHYCQTSRHVTVHNTPNYTFNPSGCPVGGSSFSSMVNDGAFAAPCARYLGACRSLPAWNPYALSLAWSGAGPRCEAHCPLWSLSTRLLTIAARGHKTCQHTKQLVDILKRIVEIW